MSHVWRKGGTPVGSATAGHVKEEYQQFAFHSNRMLGKALFWSRLLTEGAR